MEKNSLYQRKKEKFMTKVVTPQRKKKKNLEKSLCIYIPEILKFHIHQKDDDNLFFPKFGPSY